MATTTGISDEVLYTLKRTSLPARTYRGSIQANNQSTGILNGTTSTFTIPSRPKTYLDGSQSCIQFEVENLHASASITLDKSAFSLIQKIEIYNGSQLLESIANYNVLTNMLLDFQYDIGQRVGHSTEFGCSSDINSAVDAHLKGEVILATVKRTYSLPIVSGVIGSLLDKFLPLGLNDSIRLEVTWATDQNSIGLSTAQLNWQVNNPLLQLAMIELGDEAESIVRKVAGATPIIHGTQYRCYSSVINAGQASGAAVNTLVPARFASLNAFLIACRNYATTAYTNYNIGSRVNPFSRWNLRIGSEQYPQRMMDSDAECAVELKKVFGILNTTEGGCSVLKNNYYGIVDGTNATSDSYKNAHGLGISLETFAHRSSTINSGLSTLNTSIFLYGEMVAANTNQLQLDCFAIYDSLLVVENGLLSVRF